MKSDNMNENTGSRLSASKPLTKLNFLLMACAGAVIVLGFLLMTGPGSGEGEFNPDIFSTRRVVVGPTIAFIGYLLMGVGIMWRRKPSTSSNPDSQK